MSQSLYFHINEDNVIISNKVKDSSKTYVKYKENYYYTLSYTGFIPKNIVKSKLIAEIDKHILVDSASSVLTESNDLPYATTDLDIDKNWIKFFTYILSMTFPVYDKKATRRIKNSIILTKPYFLNTTPAKFNKEQETRKSVLYTKLFNPLIAEIRTSSHEDLNLKLRKTLMYFLKIPSKVKDAPKYRFFRYNKSITLVTKYISHLKQIIYQIKTCNSDEFNTNELKLNSYSMFFNNSPYIYFSYNIQHTPTLKAVTHKPFKCVYMFSTYKENIGKKPVHLIMDSLGFKFPTTFKDMKKTDNDTEDEQNEESEVEELDNESNSDDDAEIVDLNILNEVRRINRTNRLTWRIFANLSGDNLYEYIQYPTLFFSIDKELYKKLKITITEKSDVVMNISRRDPILTFTNVDNGNVVFVDVEDKDRQIRKVVDLFRSTE